LNFVKWKIFIFELIVTKRSHDSPPEAAIEATPETTPYVTPVKVCTTENQTSFFTEISSFDYF